MDLWTRFRGEDPIDTLELELDKAQTEELELDECLVVNDSEEPELEDPEPDVPQRQAA